MSFFKVFQNPNKASSDRGRGVQRRQSDMQGCLISVGDRYPQDGIFFFAMGLQHFSILSEESRTAGTPQQLECGQEIKKRCRRWHAETELLESQYNTNFFGA